MIDLHAVDVAGRTPPADFARRLVREGAAGVDVELGVSIEPVAYEVAVAQMEERVEAIASGKEPELLWLLEHPPLYTAGTSANPTDLLDPHRFPVHRTGRGGQFTYHGPGQIVAYVMLDVRARGGDLHAFVQSLECWMIAALARLGVAGVTRAGRVGVWVSRDADGLGQGAHDDKIAALGVRIRRGISYHGMSLNVAPDLSHFAGIVPCGIRDHGVTSLSDLGVHVPTPLIVEILAESFVAEVLSRLPKR
jgi:lipoyl(octanoyl) transferase